ncbi:hypothetical protein [Streptomyces sp.]|uniref:hypothetical protein n=1 Tax=Streptomyces sp. TaxID=1931 RepID=UPI002F94110D
MSEQTTWKAGPHRELSIRYEGGIPVPDVTLPCAQTGCDARYVLPTHRPDWAPGVTPRQLPSCSSEVLYAFALQAGWHLEEGRWLCPSSRPVHAVPVDMEHEREISATQEFVPVLPADEPEAPAETTVPDAPKEDETDA